MQNFLRPFALAALVTASAHAELSASFESGTAKDVRADRIPALLVKAGESPTPFLPAGAFATTWTGKLVLKERQRLEFSFEGEGSAVLTINGEEQLKEEGTLGAGKSKSLRLNGGEHEISIVYRSKPDGSGRFRLFWEERSFTKQTVPPTVFKSDVPVDLVRQGRLLFAENHCSKCHTGSLGTAPMMDLVETPPLLFNVGDRLNEEWVARWIADPAALRPDTRMPKLVDASTPQGKQDAADMAAWLMTLKMGAAPAPAPDKALAQKGGEHFHRLGCAACHTKPDQPELDTGHDRISLANVGSKFQPGALTEFLKNPGTHGGVPYYAAIRMPNFGMSDDQAKEVSAYLLAGAADTPKPAAFPKGNAKRGAELANSHHCGSCHAGSGIPDMVNLPPLESIFKKDWTAAGCVSAKPGPTAAKLALSDADRTALVAFSKVGIEPLKRHVSSEYTAAKIKELRCTSCHAMDGVVSLLDSVHSDTKGLVAHVAHENEKVDQSRPHLTFLGEMLHSSYIQGMIAGTTTPRPRPWLDMKMPSFPSYAAEMATGFGRLQGVDVSTPEPPKPDPELAAIGKKIVGAEGFGCTTCHGIGSSKATAAFEVEGINFGLSHDRLRKEWYHRWMDNPAAVTPGTKMPRYAEDGKSQRPELDGDANKQYEAIWNFLEKPE